MLLGITRKYPLAFKKYPTDAGYDMYAISSTILWPFSTEKNTAEY